MLEHEFLHAMDGFDERSSAWLKRQGVGDIALDMWPGPIGVASIETHPMGIFEFVEDRRRAFIQPVLCGPAFSEIVDLVAWYPDQPGTWWTRCYSGVPLGADELDHAEIEGLEVLIHPTPLDWLRSEGRGVCVLDWTMSAHSLRCVPTLVFDDAATGKWAHDRLAQSALAVLNIKILTREAA